MKNKGMWVNPKDEKRLLHGLCKFFWSGGGIMECAEYKHGDYHGIYTAYDHYGVVEEIGFMKQNVDIGFHLKVENYI